jgi:hypothetical protein
MMKTENEIGKELVKRSNPKLHGSQIRRIMFPGQPGQETFFFNLENIL